MKKAFCVIAILLITASFAFAQNEVTDFEYVRGISSPWGFEGIPEFSALIFPYNTLDPYFNFNSSGHGARSLGMGGVYYAMNNQAYGSFLNPAGMAYVDKALMSFDVGSYFDKYHQPFLYLTPDFRNPELSDSLINLYFAYNEGGGIDAQHNRLSAAAAVAPFYYMDKEWWFGGGFRTVYDLHYEVTTPLFIDDDHTSYTQHRAVDAINMALASNLMPELALGINMNIYVRGYEVDFRGPYYTTNEFGDTVTTILNVHNKSSFSGVNFDIGAVANFDMFRVGAVVSTPYDLTQKTTILRGEVNPFGETEGLIDRFTSTNKFPTTYGGGIAFTPTENLELGFDITNKPFSKLRIDVNPQQNAFIDIFDYNPQYEDLLQYRAGLEYIINAGFAKIPLRAGLQNIPSLKKNTKRFVKYNPGYLDSVNADSVILADSTFYGDQFNTNLFTIGTGLNFEKVWFDFAYQFGSSDYRIDFVQRVNMEGPEFESDDPINFKYSRLYFSVGMLF